MGSFHQIDRDLNFAGEEVVHMRPDFLSGTLPWPDRCSRKSPRCFALHVYDLIGCFPAEF